jgi:hypothetical protein
MSSPFFSTARTLSFLIFLVQPLQHQPLPVRPILQLRQFLGLGGFEKLPEEFAVNSKLPVEVSRITNAIAVLGEGIFDVGFERCFVGLADHTAPFRWI